MFVTVLPYVKGTQCKSIRFSNDLAWDYRSLETEDGYISENIISYIDVQIGAGTKLLQ